MRVCQSKARIQGSTKVSRVTKCNWKTTTTEGERSLPEYQGSRQVSQASPTFAKKGGVRLAGHGFTVCAVHQTFPFAKVGLICETIDRDEERGGKQQEIVKKTNTRRLRVYYLYTMPHI